MADENRSASQDKETGRLEAFSDGVFSIAMTLLALELKVPAVPAEPTTRKLLAALGQQWPSYFAFVTSFFTVLIMWVNHHGIFRLVRRIDSTLLFANGFLLLLVTAVPFPTALVAAYLRTPAGGGACALYGAMFVLISTSYGLLLLAAGRADGRLLAPGSLPEVRQRVRDCFFVGLPLYLLATALSPLSRWAGLGICSALWVFWTVSRPKTWTDADASIRSVSPAR